jgi:eukaryotic-like serine/threonine-protein kinase
MADPERTQSVPEPEGTVNAGPVSSDGITLMPPSEVPEPADLRTIPVESTVDGDSSQTLAVPELSDGTAMSADSSQTLALPAEPSVAPHNPTEAPPTLAPPTVAPPRFDFPNVEETLAPPQTPVGAGEATEWNTQPGGQLANSSGTLLDVHLASRPEEQVTREVGPAVVPRVTGPGRAVPPPAPSAPSTVARPLAMKTGQMPVLGLPQVPGYDVLGELGRGGMGVVYKARQQGLNRIVALKMVLTAGRASPDELARFHAEAEAVALLHHPNIVQVYDVGTYQGAPYFSLEFCQGGTLADRVSGKPQPPRVAARIVRDLARAIHHAHQRLILHRDLKPANVLIVPAEAAESGPPPGGRKSGLVARIGRSTDRQPSAGISDRTTEPAAGGPRRPRAPGTGGPGRRGDAELENCIPKITDFGLAKRLEGDAGQTRDGSVMGTPSYMAPEQAKGKVRELGPPADVYALGAILYDLLTGNPPFRGDTVMDTLHQVINREPVAPQDLHAHVPVDLDTICLKCLEKDPAARYASADALAEDLRRFLDREPILARPTPWWEKTIKWARRRPTQAVLAAVCLLALVGFGAGGYVLAQQEFRRARQEADNAARESELRTVAVSEKEAADAQRQRAEGLQGLAEDHFRKACAAVDALLARVGHERLAHEPRMEQIRRELLQQAATFYEGFLKERGDDPSVKWQTARTQKNLGDIQEMLGNVDQADQRYRAALGLYTDLHSSAPDDLRYRRDLAATQHNLGLLLTESGRTAEAEKALRSARDVRLALLDATPDEETRGELAASDHALGLLLERRKDLAGAEAAFKSALEQQKKVVEGSTGDSRVVKAWREVARSDNSLGRLAETTFRKKEAEGYFDSARGILSRLAADSPKVPELRQELGQTLENLGRLHRDTDPAAAQKDYAEAVRVADKLANDFPATPGYRQDLAAALNNLGLLLLATGRSGEADQAFVRALTLKERLAAEVHWVPDYRRDYGAGLNNRGIQLKTEARSSEADKTFARAISVLTDLTAEHPDVPDYQHELAKTLINRALVQQSEGRLDAAESSLQKGLVIQEKLAASRDALPEHRSEMYRTRVTLGTLYLLRSQTIARSDVPKAREELARAESEYRSALEGFKELTKAYPKEPDFRYNQALASSALAGALAAGKRSAEAQEQWGLAAGLLAPLADEHPDVPGYRLDLGRTLNNWALNCAMTRDLKKAEDLWNSAAAALGELVRVFPRELAGRQELATVEKNLGGVAVKSNSVERATAAFRKSVAALEGLPADERPGPDYRHHLINCRRELAIQLATTGAPSAGVESEFRRVVDLSRELAKDVPDSPQYASELGVAAHQLASHLLVQNVPGKARPLLEEATAAQRAAIKLAPAPQYRGLLAEHLKLLKDVLFQLDDYAAAAATTEELLALKSAAGPARHELAAEALARCAALAAADAKLSDEKRRETSRGYADRAMAELQAAVKDGFKDARELKKKPFDALRERPDFKELEKQIGT